jgi:tetratricopeptide (TPR) repeat protein
MNRGVRRLSSRVLASAFLLVAAGSLWQASAPAAVAGVQSDLSYISNSTWTADPLAARVHVVTVVTATSNTLDAAGRRYYYDHIQLNLPAFSTDLQALSVFNKPLPTSVESTSAAGVTVVVTLGERLYSGMSTTFSLRFDLVDSGGSTDRDFRIGQKVMSFPVSAFGSPSTPGSTVTVIFPPAFTVQEELGNLTRAVYGSGEVVFSSGVIDDSTELTAWFTAVQPVPATDFRVRSVAIGPLDLTLRYWVDDVGWADQVERVLRLGYPILREMIGLGDPIEKSLTVEEASTQDLGFSGSYDLSSGQVKISYFADPYVILHEMAHAWFNSDLVTDRWIQEGFASYYAQRTVDQLGLPDHAPVLTERMRQAAVPLADWVDAGQPDSPTEAYLYGAALETAREIAALAGPSGLRLVWAAARSGKAAYQPAHGPQNELVIRRTADSRRLLDLLEGDTGRSYETIWQEWVFGPSLLPLLQQRSTALSAYANTQTEAGSWDLPPEIRRALDDWQFDQAVSFMSQTRTILSQRDQIAIAAAAQGTAPPPALRIAFEKSGIIAASSEAGTELAVLNALAAAAQARTDNGDAARAVGLIGTDPQADLIAARDAFARGDMSRALALATSARSAWQGANDAGRMRILGTISVLAGLSLLLVLVLWRRGASRRMSMITAEATAGGSAAADGGSAGASGDATGSGDAAPARGPSPPARSAPIPVMGDLDGGGAPDGATDAATNGAASGATGAEGAEGAAAGGHHGRSHAGQGNGLLSGGHNGESNSEEDGVTAAGSGDGNGDTNESAYELLQRGTALLADRHNAQAAVVLERASRLEQSKGSILEALGRAYFNSGQHARAAETFEALLEVDPSAHYGHFALGMSFARLGRAQEAKTHLRLAVALDPGSETYRRALARVEAPEA